VLRDALPRGRGARINYDDAVQAGLLSTYLVAAPRYYGQRQVDPWMVGQVVGTELWAVIAHWGDVGDKGLDIASPAPRERRA